MKLKRDLAGQDNEGFSDITVTSCPGSEKPIQMQVTGENKKPLTKEEEALGVPDQKRKAPDDDQKKDSSSTDDQKTKIAGFSIPECLVPNKNLISVKLHYFWISMTGAPIWLFLPLILRQRGVSPEGMGLITSINPVITLILGTLLITVTDRFKTHRLSLITATAAMSVALAVVYWLPHVGGGVHLLELNATDRLSNETGTLDPTAYGVLSANQSLVFNVTNAINPTTYEVLSANQSLGLNTTSTINSTAYGVLSLNAMDAPNQNSYDASPYVRLPEYDNATDSERELHQNTSTNTSGGTSGKIEYSIKQLVHMTGFWVFLGVLLTSSLSHFVNSNMTDTICFMKLGKDDHLYGQQRLFSAVSWGICALFTGSILDLYSLNLPERDYFPSFLLVVIFGSIDLLVVTRMDVPQQEKITSERPSAMDFLRVILIPKNFLFFITVLMLSVSHIILSNFHMLLVEDVANAWNPDFKALRTLQGLLIVFRCHLGEVPVFIFSGDILLKIGVTGSLVVVLACHTLRYVLYYTITNPWYFLPVELFHGINYGLYKSTISYKANEMAPTGTTSTMLAVVKIVQFFGRIISGVTAGALWSQVGGHGTFLSLGLFLLGYNILYSTVAFLLKIFCRQQNGEEKKAAIS